MILAFRSWATSSILDNLPWSMSPFEYHSAIACITSWRIDADWPWQRKRENSKTVVHRHLAQQVVPCVTSYRYSWHNHSGKFKALNQWMAHECDNNNYYFVTEIFMSGGCKAPQFCRTFFAKNVAPLNKLMVTLWKLHALEEFCFQWHCEATLVEKKTMKLWYQIG